MPLIFHAWIKAKNYLVVDMLNSGQSRATAGSGETFLQGPPNILVGPLWGENFWICFKWYILVYFILLSNDGAPKRHGARIILSPYLTLLMGLCIM